MKPTSNINKLAAIIVERVNSVDEVSFNKMSNGSLCHYIAMKLKITRDRRLRNHMISLWKKGPLLAEVRKILNQKHTNSCDLNKVNEQHKTNCNLELPIGTTDCLQRSYDIEIIKDCKHSFKRINIVGDGNCLFRALSYAIFGKQELHDTIRRRIVDFVTDNFNELQGSLNASSVRIKYENAQHYRSVMGNNGVYGTDFEIGQFCNVYNKTVNIWKNIANKLTYHSTLKSKHNVGEQESSINILFEGNDQSGHFEFLEVDIVKNLTTNESLFLPNKDVEVYNSPKREDTTLPNSSIHTKNKCSNDLKMTEIQGMNENNYKLQKRKRENIYKQKNGSFDIQTYTITTGQYIDVPLLKFVIRERMKEDMHCSCPLSFYGDIRKNRLNWVTYANCLVRSHPAKYRFDITELDSNYIRVYISSNTILPYDHHEDDKIIYHPISGKYREKMLRKLKYRSTCYAQFKENGNCDRELLSDDQYLNEYNDIKSEDKCSKQKSLKSRDVSDVLQMYIDDCETEDPFIRLISVPLIFLYTKAQLRTIHLNNPLILHFDSTECIIRKPDFTNSTEMVCFSLIHEVRKSAIPIAQMLALQHDIPSISIFIMYYKAFLCQELGEDIWPFAKAIVIDWSWTLMNSFIFQLNEINMQEYLNICNDYLIRHIVPTNITILLGCCAHTIHRVRRMLNSKYSKIFKLKTLILHCIVLLILCRDINTMDKIFQTFLYILLTKDKNLTKYAIDSLKFQINLREIDLVTLLEESLNLEEKISEEDQDLEYLQIGDELPQLYDKSNALFVNSPFLVRYWAMLIVAQDSIDKNEKNLEEITNEYYSPVFAKHFTMHFMPFCSIWSGLMLDLVDTNISHVSNNVVQSHHRIFTENILRGKTNNSVGDVIRALREHNNYIVSKTH